MPQSAKTPSSTPAWAGVDARDLGRHRRQPGEHRVDLHARSRRTAAPSTRRSATGTAAPRCRRAPPRCRAPRCRGSRRGGRGAPAARSTGAPRSTASAAHMPSENRQPRGVGDRHGDDRRHRRADRHDRHVERGHRADAVREVALHDRRQQHVAAAGAEQGEHGADEQHGGVGGDARSRWPTTRRAAWRRAARPRARGGATRAAPPGRRAPKIRGGAAPMTESTRWSSGTSAAMWSRIGDIAPTAVRMVSATSTMPTKARMRPRASGAGAGVVTSSA